MRHDRAILLILIVAAGPLVAQIPMPALVAVMIMVSIGTFSWGSIRDLRSHPWQSSVVMLATVVVVVWTHDLAQGVFVGVLLSGLFFAGKVRGLFNVGSQLSADERTRHYTVTGEVFFASVERFISSFDSTEDIDQVTIDVSQSHFWDITAVDALDRVVARFRKNETDVELIGVSVASAAMIDQFSDKKHPAMVPGGI